MLRWNKVAAVIRREYLSRVRTKAFWISTLAFPVVVLTFAVLPGLLSARAGGTFTIALVAADPELGARVEQRLEAGSGGGDGERVQLTVVREEAQGDAVAQRAALKRDVLAKRINGAALLPASVLDDGRFEYLTVNTSAWQLMSRIERAVQRASTSLRLERAGIAPDSVEALTQPADLRPVRIGEDGSEDASSALGAFFLAYTLMFLLWITLMVYGMYVMRSVLEEKSSRIVEVIVANVRPFELMAGKIAGVGAVGLTQYLIWTVLAFNVAAPGLALIPADASAAMTPSLLVFFVVFFLLGYALYSTIYAALGSAFSNEEEAQQMQSVAGWIMAVPFLMMFPVMNNPDSTLSVVLSLVPFFAPVLFFLRMAVGSPPAWQTALCIVLLLVTIVGTARFAAAIYRVGILTVGKRPTMRELLAWARS